MRSSVSRIIRLGVLVGLLWVPRNSQRLPAQENSHWSFAPPVATQIPRVNQTNWCRNPIDQFVLEKLEARQLAPAPAADKYTLLRRMTYDLTGLPPTAEEVTAFLNDESPSAYESAVDRLLASPRYGERWGRHWLDLVRYTDDFEEAWRYRDWVIRAWNQDQGYDRFIIYQIAGDLLPADPTAGRRDSRLSRVQNSYAARATSGDQAQAINVDGIVATTMLSIGPWGGIDRKKRLADIVDDQIDIVGRSFLGMTLACARCHDHKFDPVTAEDYYALAGIFYSSHVISDAGYLSHGTKRLRIPLESNEEVLRHDQQVQEIQALESKLKQAVDDRYEEFARGLIPKTADYLQAAFDYEFWPTDQPKPAMKDYAAQRSLHAFAVERWPEYLKGQRVGSSRLLTHPVADYDGEKGIQIWRSSAERPWWGVNTNSFDVPIETFNLPPRTVSYYPSVEGGSVAWKSPISGRVRVSGRLVDADPLDGVGIAWVIDHVSQTGRRELSHGTMPANGFMRLEDGRHAADRMSSIVVKEGDLIEFQAWLSQGDAHYDVTNVEFQVMELGTGTTWNLARDVMDNLLQGNPHGDSHGNPDVWSFRDLEGSHRKQRMPAVDQLLDAWKALLPGGTIQRDASAFASASQQLQAVIDTSGDEGPVVWDLTGIHGPYCVRQRDDAKYLSAEAQADLARQSSELEAQKAAIKPLSYANGIQEGGLKFSSFPQIQDVRMHMQGSADQLGETVVRRFPASMKRGEQHMTFTGSGRLELAHWIASSENPLTARVIVNRIWQELFAEGLVRTSSNFGALGDSPTHQQLLDWLAVELVDSEWSIKSLTRLIVTSATYQQSSSPSADLLRADPDNHFLDRMNRRRLDAEAISDSLLAVSGRLDEKLGGTFVDRGRPRRMVYQRSSRSDKSGFGALFDAADPAMHVEKRTSTTIAPQVLELMNGPLVMELAADLVRGWKATDDAADRIHQLYGKVFGRKATPDEVSIGRQFLTTFNVLAVKESAEGPRAWETYAQVLLLSNEFLYVD